MLFAAYAAELREFAFTQNVGEEAVEEDGVLMGDEGEGEQKEVVGRQVMFREFFRKKCKRINFRFIRLNGGGRLLKPALKRPFKIFG